MQTEIKNTVPLMIDPWGLEDLTVALSNPQGLLTQYVWEPRHPESTGVGELAL